MTEEVFQLVRGVGFLLALGLAVGLQQILPQAALRGSWRVNGSFWILDAVIMALVCGACACTVGRWAEGQGLGVVNAYVLPTAVAIPLTILGLDFVSWAWHRANHRIPFLWRFHQVHHSDPAFSASTGLRFHPGELLLSLPVRLVAVVALGAPAVGIVVFEIAFAFSNLFEHGNIRLPLALERRLSWIVVTPALHRHHHSVEKRELDSNYGTIFTVWDRAFRTLQPETSARQIRTGLPYGPESPSLADALRFPLAAPPWRVSHSAGR